jgi:hypothetical protein
MILSSSSSNYTTRITLYIKFKSIPNERMIFGPQVNCRAHYFKPSTPIILDPDVDKPGVVKVTSAEISNRDIAKNDICIIYLNYGGVIKTAFIYDPKGDNIFTLEVD